MTFLDNHDQHRRFYYRDPVDPHRFDDQLTLGLTCLVSLQGIPCLYYGTEQGLAGQGRTLEAVREALWGRPNAFDPGHPFYQTIQQLTTLRKDQPALRYGRQYFRPLSGDGVHFGISRFPGGVLAFSRILNDREMVVVANTNTQDSWAGDIILDFALNPDGSRYRVLFSNQQQPAAPMPVMTRPGPGSSLEIREVDGTVTHGPARILRVSLRPMEVQILGRV